MTARLLFEKFQLKWLLSQKLRETDVLCHRGSNQQIESDEGEVNLRNTT